MTLSFTTTCRFSPALSGDWSHEQKSADDRIGYRHGAGIFLSAFVYREFKQVSAAPPVVQMRHIVVAAAPLQLGTRLDSAMLRTIPWPAGQPVLGMFTRVEDCTRRALITAVAENEPILESKLAPVEAGAGLSATIPEGRRALSVAVNDVVGVAGFVTPGTMVDVLSPEPLPDPATRVAPEILPERSWKTCACSPQVKRSNRTAMGNRKPFL